MTEEFLTPEEIEDAVFTESQHGYDKSRVESYLRTVAAQVRDLMHRLELATQSVEKPYLGLGREMGELLDHARKLADHITTEARREAAELLENTRTTSVELTRGATEGKLKSEREAQDILRKARTEAVRLRERAAEIRRFVEAEAAVLRQEAQREAKALRAEAKKEAQSIRQDAELEAAAGIRQLERRIRKLQEMELELRDRIRSHQGQASDKPEGSGASEALGAAAERR